MKVLCNLATKKIEGFSRWDDISFDSSTHIVLIVTKVPDMESDKLNETGDGIEKALPPTEAELAATERQEYIDSAVVAIQSVMDGEASDAGFYDLNSVVTYADEASVPQFQANGLSFRAWRSRVWEYAYTTLALYEAALLAYPDLLAQYDIDKAQYDIDIVAEPPLDPLPVEPTAPDEVVKPTIEQLVAGMPAR